VNGGRLTRDLEILVHSSSPAKPLNKGDLVISFELNLKERKTNEEDREKQQGTLRISAFFLINVQ
jgi:hypothetical protein